MSASSIDGSPEVDHIAQAEIGSTVQMPGVTPPNSDASQPLDPSLSIKRGRGRPPGSKNKTTVQAEKLDISSEALQSLIIGIFDILGARQEHWKLSPAEAKSLTEVTYRFLVSISDKIGKFVGIGAVITMWGVIIVPRLVKTKQLQIEAKDKHATFTPVPETVKS